MPSEIETVLVMPPGSMEDRWGKGLARVGHLLPPLGLAYIAAVLEKNSKKVRIIDCQALEMGADSLVKELGRVRPGLVGITVSIVTSDASARTARLLKETLPEARIIFGGPHPSAFPSQVLKENPSVDMVAFGEGEYTILDVVNALENGGSLKGIRGLAYREGGRIIMNGPRELIKDLDSLPFPARHLLPMNRYRVAVNGYKRKPVTTMICSRGCPFNCIFCSSKNVFGRVYRARSPENVIEEMRLLKREYGVREINFWDDLWGYNDEWVERFCDLLIKEDLGIIWSCETRVNRMDARILKKMARAGCWNIFYGIESGSQELLNNIRKGITIEQIRKTIKATKEAGIEIRGNFMLALPGETPELAQKTIDLAKELNCDYVKFNVMFPFPGTDFFKEASKWGEMGKDPGSFRSYRPNFVPRGYRNAEEVLAVRRRAFLQYHMRPRYLLSRIARIRSIEDLRRNLMGIRAVLKL